MLLVRGSRKCVSDSAQPDAKDRTVAATTTLCSYSGSESMLAGPPLYHCPYLRPVAAAFRLLQTTSTAHKGDFVMSHLGGLVAADGVACSRLLAMHCPVCGWNTGRTSPFARIARSR